jgi:hypothetical protein
LNVSLLQFPSWVPGRNNPSIGVLTQLPSSKRVTS